MVACLWGAQPNETPAAVKDAIYKSADRYLNPDDQFGYGVPDYFSAYQKLAHDLTIPIESSLDSDVTYSVFTIDGKLIDKGILYYNNPQDAVKIIKPQTAGVYIINLTSEDDNISKKFIIVE